ncbi:MAG: hypothetical protein P8X79_21170 [Reinekea sp.]
MACALRRYGVLHSTAEVLRLALLMRRCQFEPVAFAASSGSGGELPAVQGLNHGNYLSRKLQFGVELAVKGQ